MLKHRVVRVAPIHKLMFCLCLICVAALLAPGAAFARVVEVQKEKVNIRQGAGTNTAVIGKAGKGGIYGWSGAAGDWTKISLPGGKSGFIRNDLLKAYDDILVTGSSVRIRKSPSLQGSVIGSANKGDKLAVSDYQDGWYKISANKKEGWISADYSKLAGAAATVSVPVGQAGQNDRATLTSQVNPGFIAHNFNSATVSSNTTTGALSGKIITLDPGHGFVSDDGKPDPGALSARFGIWEKDINLDVSLKLKAILESYGATVWMTHEGRTEMSLSGRAALANQNGSNIFVSVHTNSSDNPEVNGHSVYYYAPFTDLRLLGQRPLRQALAKYILDGLIKTTGQADLGVRESGFVVLKETSCPSVLVETAFMSHEDEEALLTQSAFRQRLAESIAGGILKYFGVS